MSSQTYVTLLSFIDLGIKNLHVFFMWDNWMLTIGQTVVCWPDINYWRACTLYSGAFLVRNAYSSTHTWIASRNSQHIESLCLHPVGSFSRAYFNSTHSTLRVRSKCHCSRVYYIICWFLLFDLRFSMSLCNIEIFSHPCLCRYLTWFVHISRTRCWNSISRRFHLDGEFIGIFQLLMFLKDGEYPHIVIHDKELVLWYLGDWR